jgi:glycosyltransferase XagB
MDRYMIKYKTERIKYYKLLLIIILVIFSIGYYIKNGHHIILEYIFLLFHITLIIQILFKGLLIAKGLNKKYPNLDNKISYFPKYTILVPLYKETRIIEQLLESLDNIEYPKDSLEIFLVTEDDDKATNQYLNNLQLPYYIKIICCQNSFPKTKANACNYALKFATGKYLTIYDAEDIPDPKQLIKALNYFAILSEKYFCIQCQLNFYNRNINYLTKFFSIEYFIWFNLMLPGLEQCNMVVPLGGTSNHFKLDKLIEIGGWDPFNVTEDAELALRIYNNKYQIANLKSTTMEEAPSNLKIWTTQRTRWIKGHLQTYISYLTNQTYFNKLSNKQALSIHLFFGLPIILRYLSPIAAYIGVAAMIGHLNISMPNLFVLSKYLLTILYIQQVISAVIICICNKWYKTILVSIFYPMYFFLHIFAAFRALFQLFYNPFMWEKTEHGFYTKKNLKNLNLDNELED